MTSREPYRGQRIGLLRERVTLQEVELVPDGYGGFDPVWQDRGTVAARVEPLKGDERVIAGSLTATFDVLVHIRHRSDLTTDWRLLHAGEPYSIVATRNLDERRRFLTLECKGGVAT